MEAAVYAVDCEFVQMKRGLALAQIVMVDHMETVVMNDIIQPPEPIVDYLPQYSNLTEKNFQDNCLSEIEFHAKVSRFLGPNVILIGHSLHCDLMKMKVIHDKVIDTSRLYTHPDGADFTLSLQSLAVKYLSHNNISPYDRSSKPHQDALLALRLFKLRANDIMHQRPN